MTGRAEPSYLVLDIETVLDAELCMQASTEGATALALPAAPHHRVAVIGVCWLDRTYDLQRFGIVGSDKSEEGILTDFVRFLEDRQPTMVTWNGRGFDLPVIAARCLRYGLSFARYYSTRDIRYRFSSEGHFDLMDFLADFGASRPARLDAVARLIGLPGKVGVDGADVEPLLQAGKLNEVQAYCLSDVIQTAAIFLRVQLLRGAIARDRYRIVMRQLLDRAAADERLAPVVTGTDAKRLLLE